MNYKQKPANEAMEEFLSAWSESAKESKRTKSKKLNDFLLRVKKRESIK